MVYQLLHGKKAVSCLPALCFYRVLVCVAVGCLLPCIGCVGGSARSYSGLCSCTCCSVISLPCCWYICMYKFSQLFMRSPFLQGCINLSVSSTLPYSCLLFNICVAYADVSLLVLIYRICYLYLSRRKDKDYTAIFNN